MLEALAEGLESRSVKILYVGVAGFLDRPTGAGLRYRMVQDALRRAGEVQVFEIEPDHGARQRLWNRFVRRHAPRPFADARTAHAARRGFAALHPSGFDLLWFASIHTFGAVDPRVDVPVIVDLARLESLTLAREDELASTAIGDDRAKIREYWMTLETEVGRRADFVTLCNEVDRELLGKPASEVIPTGYATPRRPRTDWTLHHPPTLLMQGTLYLEQNFDAAVYAAREILPRVRAGEPGAELRIVGPAPPTAVRALGGAEGVTVTGWVENMSAELANADIVVAPIRHGGGIHVKVIEAFAHQVPVVTTPIGIEGSHAVPGAHLLVASDVDEFATHCVTLLGSETRRRALAERAFALYQDRFELTRVEARVTDLARAIGRRDFERSA